MDPRNPSHVFVHVGIENAAPHPFVGDNGSVKISIARPMVAVGFGVDDIAQLTMFGDFRFQLQGITGFMGTINHNNPLGGRDEHSILP